MKGWNITVRAVVIKTIEVTKDEADTEEEAIELAHRVFSVSSDDTPERFEQYTEDVKEIIEEIPEEKVDE